MRGSRIGAISARRWFCSQRTGRGEERVGMAYGAMMCVHAGPASDVFPTVEERRGWLFPIESVRLTFGCRTNNGSGELVRDVFGSVVARFIAPASLGLG